MEVRIPTGIIAPVEIHLATVEERRSKAPQHRGKGHQVPLILPPPTSGAVGGHQAHKGHRADESHRPGDEAGADDKDLEPQPVHRDA